MLPENKIIELVKNMTKPDPTAQAILIACSVPNGEFRRLGEMYHQNGIRYLINHPPILQEVTEVMENLKPKHFIMEFRGKESLRCLFAGMAHSDKFGSSTGVMRDLMVSLVEEVCMDARGFIGKEKGI